MKIIIGAGNTRYDGWVATQQTELDLLDPNGFARISGGEPITALLAEHVWEHMTLEEGMLAAKHCYDALAPGGYIRAAVPDRNFRNDWYQQLIRPGGNGDPSHPSFTHKIAYDYQMLQNVFEQAGFEVELLEWCDQSGAFHYKYWNDADGHIGRSLRYDTRNRDGKLGMVSIIIDAKKPGSIRSY